MSFRDEFQTGIDELVDVCGLFVDYVWSGDDRVTIELRDDDDQGSAAVVFSVRRVTDSATGSHRLVGKMLSSSSLPKTGWASRVSLYAELSDFAARWNIRDEGAA